VNESREVHCHRRSGELESAGGADSPAKEA
jgi:hypothetical protein